MSLRSLIRKLASRSRKAAVSARCAGFLLLASAFPGVAPGASLGEYQAKAAFLYNFTKFTEWPGQAFSGAASPLQICVLGDDPFGSSVDALAERSSQGRTLVVRRVSSAGQGSACHILFIAASEEGRMPQILAALGSRPVLTVGDFPGFAESGGMINLSLDDGRVRMDINVEAAQRAGLRISSQVLRLARIVKY